LLLLFVLIAKMLASEMVVSDLPEKLEGFGGRPAFEGPAGSAITVPRNPLYPKDLDKRETPRQSREKNIHIYNIRDPHLNTAFFQIKN